MIRVALYHKSSYVYDRPVELGPQVVRLRPAPHCRTPISAYSLKVTPDDHFLNWQQDPHSNYLARLVFAGTAQQFEVEVNLIADMTVINPFNFFLESSAAHFPFAYDPQLAKDLKPYLETMEPGSEMTAFLSSVDRSPAKSNDFLVSLNQKVQHRVEYLIRMEPGVQSPEETLRKGSGSCRDSAWLFVQVLRHLGLAARFVSGYLIQLKPDIASLDGPVGAEEDFTDLHAWTEVYLPGAGWIGLDPTSGLFTGEGHIPLAATPEPTTAAPITGTVSQAEVEFHHEMSIARIHEDPRVTKPYSAAQWEQIQSVGRDVDARLNQGDVRLTMGGEPTFVSVDDMDGAEWQIAAVGPNKKRLANDLISRLKQRFASGGLLHYGQGKWYPGEPLPRWAFTCLWRTDGQPIWGKEELLADLETDYGHTSETAVQFSQALARRLNLDPNHAVPAYEDGLYSLWKEQRLSANAKFRDEDYADAAERDRLARLLELRVGSPVGCLLPLAERVKDGDSHWVSGRWPVKSDHLFLIPGDSPMGLRLPLDSLPSEVSSDWTPTPTTPFAEGEPVLEYEQVRQQIAARRVDHPSSELEQHQVPQSVGVGAEPGVEPGFSNATHLGSGAVGENGTSASNLGPSIPSKDALDAGVIRTAMCLEARNGRLHVFMPPTERLEGYLELLTAVELTAEELNLPVVVEGYLPPHDYRLQSLRATPDPGVIEVNVQPAGTWNELVEITTGVYEDAHQSRLGTEKFDLDGTHTGTGGGNHIVLGGRTPSDSPFLRRPDLLRSLLGYWHNHPSLSYLFSGKFIGPTSQAPRVDEGRRDAAYELEIAFDQIPDKGECPPWVVDRAFRNLLIDLTGNTHRAEFCIDKLYSPDSSTGRLGLVELRAFEMPPHAQMSLTQQLLLRALVARFWERPYVAKLADWNTSIHDRWMLPHFIRQDFEDVIQETRAADIPMDTHWFAPHFEFRFPFIGEVECRGVQVELRTAIEPWYVLGEEPAGGSTARYVDSSVERLQVKVTGSFGDHHVLTCNGRKVPLQSTGAEGEAVAAVRYRAWQPPSCLHPTIPVDVPLVFDVVDTRLGRSIGGCKYHVSHPGGLNPDSFPVNAYEAESRRGCRFVMMGHRGGELETPIDEQNSRFPLTLDLRRHRNRT